MTNGIFSAYFTLDDVPATGLTATIDIERVPLDGSAAELVVTGASMTEGITNGFYSYRRNDFDTSLYKYNALAKTAGDVDVANLPASIDILESSITEQIPGLVWNETANNWVAVGSMGELQHQAAASAGGGQLTLLSPDSTNLATGTTDSGSGADLDDLDGVAWVITGGTQTIEVTFDATNLYVQELNYTARYTGHKNDFLVIEAYHPTNLSWDEISTAATQINPNEPYATKRIGINQEYVGGDGTVQIRVDGSGLKQTPTTYLDYFSLLTSTEGGYVLTASEVADATVQRMLSAVYGGEIHLDTVGGSDGTDVGISGTAQYPVQTLGNAIALAEIVKTRTISIIKESAITLDRAVEDYNLQSSSSAGAGGWSVSLAGFSIDGSYIAGAQVSGAFLASTNRPIFQLCRMMDTNGPWLTMDACIITGTITLTEARKTLAIDCITAADDLALRQIVFTDGTGSFYGYGLEVNMTISGLEAAGLVVLTGLGIVTFDATCTGGTVYVNGNWDVTNNGVIDSFNDDHNFSRLQLVDDTWDEILPGVHVIPDSAGVLLSGLPSATANAAAILELDISTIQDNLPELSLGTEVMSRLRGEVVSGFLYIKKADGSTNLYTIPTKSDPNAAPVTGVGTT